MKLKKEKPSIYRKLASKLFIDYVKKNKDKRLEREYIKARFPSLFEIYMSTILLSSILTFLVISVIVFYILHFMLNYPLFLSFSSSIFASLIASLSIYFILYFYPKSKSEARKKDIDSNLPFAIIYMAGIAKSGVTPQNIFKLLANAKGFGNVSKEAKYITYLIKKRNYSLLEALKKSTEQTPSEAWKEFIFSMLTTIKYGGDIVSFLKSEANRREVDYKLRIREYQDKLFVYSRVYVGLFMLFPIFLILSYIFSTWKMNLFDCIIVLLLPILNIMYLYYLHITQPQI